MPIYEYRCASCGFEKEYLQKVSDPPVVSCPSCGQPAMSKKVTAAGFQLKGTGWYVTDFKNKGSGKPAEKKNGADAEGTKADTASDTKSEKQEAKSDKQEAKADKHEAKADKATDAKPSTGGGGTSSESSSNKPAAA